MWAFLWGSGSGQFLTLAMISKEWLVLANPVRCLGHVRRLSILPVDIPVAMTHRPSDADVSQSQDFVFLCVVVWLFVARLAKARHAIDLILVGRTGQMLTITQQKHRVSLHALGAVIRQLFDAPRFIWQVRIHINYRLNMLFNQYLIATFSIKHQD